MYFYYTSQLLSWDFPSSLRFFPNIFHVLYQLFPCTSWVLSWHFFSCSGTFPVNHSNFLCIYFLGLNQYFTVTFLVISCSFNILFFVTFQFTFLHTNKRNGTKPSKWAFYIFICCEYNYGNFTDKLCFFVKYNIYFCSFAFLSLPSIQEPLTAVNTIEIIWIVGLN